MSPHKAFFLLVIVALTVILRTVEHPWNFVPVGALALFAGAHVRNRILALTIPLLTMLASDLALGVVRQNTAFWTFHAMIPVVYACYAVSVAMGMGVRWSWNTVDRRETAAHDRTTDHAGRSTTAQRFSFKVLPLAGATLAGSLLFYIVTNFANWAAFPTYPKTWAGLMTCYTAALPFFRTTLASDVLFVVLFFGGYELIRLLVAQRDNSSLLHVE